MFENIIRIPGILLISLIQIVSTEHCDPQSFQFKNPPLSVYKNEIHIFRINNNEELACAVGAKYNWSISKIEGKVNTYLPTNVLRHLGPDSLKYNILNLRSLPDEKVIPYTLVLRVTLIPNHKYEPAHRRWFFKAAGNVAKFEILGGRQRVHQLGSGSLWLNVTKDGGGYVEGMKWTCSPPLGHMPSSFSLEIPEEFLVPNETYTCSAKWQFRKQLYISSQTILIVKPEKLPIIQIICIENCENPDPGERTVLQCICYKHCENVTIKWTAEPVDVSVTNFMSVPRNIPNAVSFQPGAFKMGTSIDVIAAGGEAKTKYSLTFPLPNSELTITCLENCNYDPEFETAFQVQCKTNCRYLDYKWNVRSYPTSLNWPFFLNEHGNKDIITFPPYAFIEGMTVILEVRSWDNRASYSFKTINSKGADFYIHCISNCKKSDPHLPVKLKIKCKSHCKNVTWKLAPQHEKFRWYEHVTENNISLRIPANMYNYGQSITVMASAGTQKAFGKIFYELPVIELLCVGENCENSPETPDPYKTMTLRALCTKNCDGLSYYWELNPRLGETNVRYTGDNGAELIVPEGTYDFGDKLEVIVKSGEVKSTLTVQFKILQPRLGINCRRNCLSHQDPSKTTDLTATCYKHCEKISYEWRVYLNNDLKIGLNQIILDYLNETMRIMPFTFKNEELVKIEVHSNRGGYASISLRFREPAPIFVLDWNCNQSCAENESIINVKCHRNCKNATFLWDVVPNEKSVELGKNLFLSHDNTSIRIARNALPPNKAITVIAKSKGAQSTLELRMFRQALVLTLESKPYPCGGEANPYVKNKIKIECSEDCENIPFYWDVNPPPDWDNTTIRGIGNKSFVILPKTYKDGDTVVFKASGGGGEALCTLNYALPPATINISCPRDCVTPDPFDYIEMNVQCTANCDYSENCNWKLEPPPSNKINIQRGPHGQYITIKPKTYKEGDTVKTSVWCETGNASLSSKFTEKPAILEIRCLKNRFYDPAVETVLEVICLQNCLGDQEYKWSFTPTPAETVQFLNKNVAVAIAPGSYSLGDDVTVSVQKGKGSKKLEVKFEGPTPILEVRCIQNCMGGDTANPQLETKVHALCHKYCESLDYQWEIDQKTIYFRPDVDMKLNKENTTLTIAGKVYLNGTDVLFSVRSKNGVGSLIVHFIEPPSTLMILCVSNCGFPSPYDPLRLNATCFGACRTGPFVWDISPTPENFTWSQAVKTNSQNETLRLEPGYFKNGDSTTFTVRNANLKAELSLTFSAPTPKVSIFCRSKKGCLKLNASLTTSVYMTCRPKNCYEDNKFFWSMKPTPPEFIWHLNVKEAADNRSIIIARGSFPGGYETKVTIRNEKGPINSTKLRFLETYPKGFIECLQNCEYDPRKITVLRVKCTDCYKVLWSCTLRPRPSLLGDVIIKGKTIKIEKRVYQAGEKVKVTCKSANAIFKTKLHYQNPIGRGKCTIKPKQGISGKTDFAVDCIDFPVPVVYRVYQEIPEDFDSVGVLLAYSNHSYIPGIWLSPANETTIRVAASPLWGFEKVSLLDVQVKELFNATKDERFLGVKRKILGEKFDDFQELLKTKQYIRAVQLASLMESHVKFAPMHLQYHYRRHILEGILSVADRIEPSQLVSLMGKISQPKNYQTLPIIHLLTEGISNGLQRLFYENQGFAVYSHEAKEFVAYDAFESVSRILNKMMNLERKVEHDKQNGERKQMPLPEDVAYPDIWDHKKSDNIRHYNYITADIVKIIDYATDLFYERGNSRIIRNNQIKVVMLNAKHLGRKIREQPAAFVRVEKLTFIIPKSENLTIKIAYIFEGKETWWDPYFKPFNTGFIYAGLTANKTKISSAEIEIMFPIPTKSREILKGNITQLKLYVIELKVINDSVLIVDVIFDQYLGVALFLISKCYPTVSEITQYGEVIVEKGHLYRNISFSPAYISIYSTEKLTFEVKYAALQCFSWHSTEWRWTTDYCHPHLVQSETHITCACKKLSLFAANVSLPERIKRDPDFQKPIEGSFASHFYVLIVTALVLLLLLIAFLLATIKDADNKKRYKLHKLPDNDQNDKEIYIVFVQTGTWPWSGTTARVAIQVEGREGTSQVHLLNAKDPLLLQRNSSDAFIMRTPKKLGVISSITVWHDSHGQRPHWFCDTIVVRHIPARKRYIFLVSRWFSLILGDGTTKATFFPKKKVVSASYRTRLNETLKETHNYLGFWTERIEPGRVKENVAITATSILVIMLVCLLLMPSWGFTFLDCLYVLAIATVAGFLVTVILDFLFRFTT